MRERVFYFPDEPMGLVINPTDLPSLPCVIRSVVTGRYYTIAKKWGGLRMEPYVGTAPPEPRQTVGMCPRCGELGTLADVTAHMAEGCPRYRPTGPHQTRGGTK